jgi:protein SCO1/2
MSIMSGNKKTFRTGKPIFAEENIGFSKDSTEFLHTEHVILVDQSKRIRGIYNGTLSLEMRHLVEDIKTLQQEVN